VLEGAFRETLLARVREGFQIPADANYTWIQSRLWLRDALEGEGLLACFGVDERDLAVRALEAAVQVRAAGYSYVDANVPEAQHPFEQLPVVGRLFRVRWRGQRGFENLVRFESPDVGPAFRAAFDVEHPERSEWAFPLGQSGHCASDAFDSFLDAWNDGKTMPVFPDGPPTGP
jgi:acyl-homoserine lactone acylase PvdQ